MFPRLSLPIEILVILGLLLPFLESLRVTIKLGTSFESEIWRGDKDKIPSFLSPWFFCGIVLVTMPISHSLGYAYQLIKHKILGLNGW